MPLKFLLVALFILCAFKKANSSDSYHPMEKEKLVELSLECSKLHQMDQDKMVELNRSQPLETDDPKVKCAIKCFLTGLGLMNNDGELTLEKSDEKWPLKFQKYFSQCTNVTGVDACDKAYHFQNCLWTQYSLDEQKAQ